VLDRLLEAIRFTFAKYFPHDARQVLIKLLDDAQSMLPGILLPQISVSGPGSFHLNELLDATKAAVARGQAFSAALTAALAGKMDADVAAHYRQIVEDLAGKCRPSELKRVKAEMLRVMGAFDSTAEARRMLSVGPKPSKPKLELDEDIRE
jgi:hypothetical protein